MQFNLVVKYRSKTTDILIRDIEPIETFNDGCY